VHQHEQCHWWGWQYCRSHGSAQEIASYKGSTPQPGIRHTSCAHGRKQHDLLFRCRVSPSRNVLLLQQPSNLWDAGCTDRSNQHLVLKPGAPLQQTTTAAGARYIVRPNQAHLRPTAAALRACTCQGTMCVMICQRVSSATQCLACANSVRPANWPANMRFKSDRHCLVYIVADLSAQHMLLLPDCLRTSIKPATATKPMLWP
jgi:hypothetical protein